jgi:hypothetical protein
MGKGFCAIGMSLNYFGRVYFVYHMPDQTKQQKCIGEMDVA